jgi:beta-galactosidase/beta-glucuronidase
VNGEPVFIRGGNWIVSDGLLRLSEKRYKSDIDFHADMNLNMIRCWAGGITERPEFYKNCDRRGILVLPSIFPTILLLNPSNTIMIFDTAGMAGVLDNWR